MSSIISEVIWFYSISNLLCKVN